MASREPIRKRAAPPAGGPPRMAREIPDKLYFRIGEVASLCGVPAYVLRFWESEFPQLKPNKGGTGQRLYRRRDVEIAVRIKALLYDDGYTIPGARQAIRADLRAPKDLQLGLSSAGEAIDVSHFLALQKELRDLLGLLSRPPTARQPLRTIRNSRGRTHAPKLLEPTPLAPSNKELPMENLFGEAAD